MLKCKFKIVGLETLLESVFGLYCRRLGCK